MRLCLALPSGATDCCSIALVESEVKEVVQITLDSISKYASVEYSQLNDEEKQEMTEIIQVTVLEQLILSKVPNIDHPEVYMLCEYLPPEDIQIIKETFSFETYQMDFKEESFQVVSKYETCGDEAPGPTGRASKRENEELVPSDSEVIITVVDFKRGDAEFMPSKTITTARDAEDIRRYTQSSILVECIYLVLSAGGNVYSYGKNYEKVMQDVAQKTMEAIKESVHIQASMEKLRIVWGKKDQTNKKKAEAVVALIGKTFTYATKVIYTILKGFLKHVSIKKFLLRLGATIALIATAAFTEGMSLIGPAILAVANAAVHLCYFYKKIKNLDKVDEIISKHHI